MTPELELRPVTDADHDFVLSVYAGTRAEELALVPWPEEGKRAFVEMQFKAQTAHYLQHFPDAKHDVVLADGEPVGRLYIDRSEEDLHIIDIALLPHARGRGIGGALLADLIAEADAAGRPVRIYVELNNRARSLYDRLGFEEVERDGVYALMRRPPCISPPQS